MGATSPLPRVTQLPPPQHRAGRLQPEHAGSSPEVAWGPGTCPGSAPLTAPHLPLPRGTFRLAPLPPTALPAPGQPGPEQDLSRAFPGARGAAAHPSPSCSRRERGAVGCGGRGTRGGQAQARCSPQCRAGVRAQAGLSPSSARDHERPGVAGGSYEVCL